MQYRTSLAQHLSAFLVSSDGIFYLTKYISLESFSIPYYEKEAHGKININTLYTTLSNVIHFNQTPKQCFT